jgi:hypothetical protein
MKIFAASLIAALAAAQSFNATEISSVELNITAIEEGIEDATDGMFQLN